MKNAERKRKGALLVFTFAFFIFNFAFLHPAETKDSSTDEARLAVFEDVWRTIRDRYYDPSFHGVDWEAARAK
ncbi:MAG TPA: hypothetical protein VD861_13915, partial [Pyrinomonadaceae bacterium]|nr:hypothetical protein [Pyrinomonadaceae bacterium]